MEIFGKFEKNTVFCENLLKIKGGKNWFVYEKKVEKNKNRWRNEDQLFERRMKVVIGMNSFLK